MIVNVSRGPNMLKKLNIMIVPGSGNPDINNGGTDCGCMH